MINLLTRSGASAVEMPVTLKIRHFSERHALQYLLVALARTGSESLVNTQVGRRFSL